MRIVFYDPDCLELMLPALSLSSKFYEDFDDVKIKDPAYCVIPMKAKNLNDNIVEIAKSLNAGLRKIGGGEYFHVRDLERLKPEYFLLGIHPKNKYDELEIVKFFDKNSDKIKLWIDTHDWSPGLLTYLRNGQRNVFLNSKQTCLEVLQKLGYPCFEEWLIGEKAFMEFNINDPFVWNHARLITMIELGVYDDKLKKAYNFLAFIGLIEEISPEECEPYFIKLAETYSEANKIAEEVEALFKDDYPAFQAIKEMGRPAGYLLSDTDISDFNIGEILNQVGEKFPWLVVLELPFKGKNYKINFSSQKIPIADIMKSYDLENLTRSDVFNILSAEVAHYQEKEVVQYQKNTTQ